MKIKTLLYCCRNNKKLLIKKDYGYIYDKWLLGGEQALNGKIVCECDVDTEEIEQYIHYEPEVDIGLGVLPSFECNAYGTNTLGQFELLKHSCLTETQMYEYLRGKNGYALHLSNVKVFDKSRELSDVYSIKDIGGGLLVTEPLKKAPQNMMRVSINKWDYGFANEDDIRILISIRPEWLCLILNKEKDIEIRRVVLKGMVEIPTKKSKSKKPETIGGKQ